MLFSSHWMPFLSPNQKHQSIKCNYCTLLLVNWQYLILFTYYTPGHQTACTKKHVLILIISTSLFLKLLLVRGSFEDWWTYRLDTLPVIQSTSNNGYKITLVVHVISHGCNQAVQQAVVACWLREQQSQDEAAAGSCCDDVFHGAVDAVSALAHDCDWHCAATRQDKQTLVLLTK